MLASVSVPSEPTNIRVQLLANGQLSVQWEPPLQPNGAIQSYTVYYSPTGEEEWQTVTVGGADLGTVITTATNPAQRLVYVKVEAITGAGPGKETRPVPVDLQALTDTSSAGLNKSTLGIVIGASIGVICVLVCVLIILLRNRCLRSAGQEACTQASAVTTHRYHGNGHLPGNGGVDGQTTVGLEMEQRVPMLLENQHSDSKVS